MQAKQNLEPYATEGSEKTNRMRLMGTVHPDLRTAVSKKKKN
jgi:hypothetical protein